MPQAGAGSPDAWLGHERDVHQRRRRTGVANQVVWPMLYENQPCDPDRVDDWHRRAYQREGDVVHLIAYKLFELSDLLGSFGGRDEPFPLPRGRAQFARGPGTPDPRDARPKGMEVRDIFIPDLH